MQIWIRNIELHPRMGKTVITETYCFLFYTVMEKSLSAYHVPGRETGHQQNSLAELLVKMRFCYSTFSEKDCLPLQIFRD